MCYVIDEKHWIDCRPWDKTWALTQKLSQTSIKLCFIGGEEAGMQGNLHITFLHVTELNFRTFSVNLEHF